MKEHSLINIWHSVLDLCFEDKIFVFCFLFLFFVPSVWIEEPIWLHVFWTARKSLEKHSLKETSTHFQNYFIDVDTQISSQYPRKIHAERNDTIADVDFEFDVLIQSKMHPLKSHRLFLPTFEANAQEMLWL